MTKDTPAKKLNSDLFEELNPRNKKQDTVNPAFYFF